MTQASGCCLPPLFPRTVFDAERGFAFVTKGAGDARGNFR